MKTLFSLLFCLVSVMCRAQDVVPQPVRPIRVAIVIDDGPVPGRTADYIRIFNEKGVKATFSFIASALEKDPADGRAVIAAGFQVNNHSFDHRHPGELTEEELRHEVVDAQKRIAEILGTAPRFYWQPFAEMNNSLAKIVDGNGMELTRMEHVVSSLDFIPGITGEQVFKNATTGIVDGTVINFHEWSEATHSQMAAIIDELRRQGCVFVTLSEIVDAYDAAHAAK